MGDQVDLEELIARSKQAEAERQRFTIAASPKAKEYRDTVTRERGLNLVEQIGIAVNKQKDKARRKNAVPEFNGPTPERLAKDKDADIAAIVPPIDSRLGVTTKAVIIRSPLETHRATLRERLYNVGLRFLKDFDAASIAGARTTSSYGEGVGGGSYGARHGGVQDIAREANTRMMLLAAQIGPNGWSILSGLVGQVNDARMGRPPSLADIGVWLVGYKAGSDQARAAGLGSLITVLDFVDAWYSRLDHDGGSMSAEEVRARRAIMRERMDKQDRRRERDAPIQNSVGKLLTNGKTLPDMRSRGAK